MCLTSLLVYRTIIIIFTIQTGNFAVLYFLVEGLKQGESLLYRIFKHEASWQQVFGYGNCLHRYQYNTWIPWVILFFYASILYGKLIELLLKRSTMDLTIQTITKFIYINREIQYFQFSFIVWGVFNGKKSDI